MRIRTIKPEWLLSRSVASLSADARLLSVGLILMADDKGRGRAGLETIVAEVWRYHAGPDKCAETYRSATVALRELSDAGFVVLYEVDGSEYFWLPGFERNQVINKKSSSKIPPPSENSRSTTVVLPEDSQTEQGSGIRDQGKGVGSGKPASPDTHTDSEPRTIGPLAEAFRVAVVEHFESRKLPPPKETRQFSHPHWSDLARWLWDLAKARGYDRASLPDRARAVVAAFYGTDDARTKGAGYDLAFLAKRPGQYVGMEAA